MCPHLSKRNPRFRAHHPLNRPSIGSCWGPYPNIHPLRGAYGVISPESGRAVGTFFIGSALMAQWGSGRADLNPIEPSGLRVVYQAFRFWFRSVGLSWRDRARLSGSAFSFLGGGVTRDAKSLSRPLRDYWAGLRPSSRRRVTFAGRVGREGRSGQPCDGLRAARAALPSTVRG